MVLFFLAETEELIDLESRPSKKEKRRWLRGLLFHIAVVDYRAEVVKPHLLVGLVMALRPSHFAFAIIMPTHFSS